MTRPLGAHRTRMRALAREFPRQLIEGYRLGSETPVRWPKGKRGALVAGMGGSAIAADLLDGVLRPEFGWPITTIRGAEIPKWPPDVPIVLVSYSGNTSETLGAYESARATRARLVCVAAGGELARRADRDGHPNVRIPPGLPPRGALGWILGVLIGLLDPALPQTLSSRLVASAQRVDGRQREFASRHGGPAQLAHRVADRIPTILAWSGDLPVARRWQTQVEENAKRAARLEL
ncbi:MAG TPA: SIS domain-containing protein, partial [Thermoplasmata archaeon]|nr:SIS domain-containing protein [Thermoplasmata archaeon]